MTPVGWAWMVWAAFMTGVAGFLWSRLEAERERIRELQDQRVKDAMHFAGTGQGYTEPQVEKIPDAEEAGTRAVKALEVETVLDTLRRQAEEEGRQVSDSRLRKDAEKIVQRFGMGPRAPNV